MITLHDAHVNAFKVVLMVYGYGGTKNKNVFETLESESIELKYLYS
jgi:hypothetical protein